jgi:hypothetical protein
MLVPFGFHYKSSLCYNRLRACLGALHSTKISSTPLAPPFSSSTLSFLRKLGADVRVWEIVVLQLQKYENLVGIVYFAYGGWMKGWFVFSAATIAIVTVSRHLLRWQNDGIRAHRFPMIRLIINYITKYH